MPSTPLSTLNFRRTRATRLVVHTNGLSLNSRALNKCAGTLGHGMGVCIQRGNVIQVRSIQYATNYVFCIIISIAQLRGKNCNEGERSRLNPPKVPHSWRKANPGSSQPYCCNPKGLSMLPFPEGLYPHTSAGLLFPCHPPRWSHAPRAPVPPSIPPFSCTSWSTSHL